MFRLTVVGAPSDRVHVAVAVMEEEFMLGPLGSALKQLHEVMAIYLPAVPKREMNKQAAMRDTCGKTTNQHSRNICDIVQVVFQQPEI